jgi:nickel/cobalt transporter (NicO) family protein
LEILPLLLIFWYGVLHAFGPDHLTIIADFSIGKKIKKTILITSLFAIGHGISLLVFAKLLQIYDISQDILAYGDIISSIVILSIGLYLVLMVLLNKVHIKKHLHKNKEHTHIYFGAEHKHNNSDVASAFTIGILMGIAGVRGMLVTLGFVEGTHIDFLLILAFTFGVMVIFLLFGMIILYINKNLLKSKKNVKIVFFIVGVLSIIVALFMLLG